jgi:hypothetical protein
MEPSTSTKADGFPAGSLLADIPAFSAFAQDVADALDGDELRYSERQRLLQRAEHFGIRRFDANLIIAMVQERVRTEPYAEEAGRAISGRTPLVATFLLTQSLIIAAAWWLGG